MEHEATFTAVTKLKQETFYHKKMSILYNFPRFLIVKLIVKL